MIGLDCQLFYLVPKEQMHIPMEDHTAIYIYNSYYNIVIILVGFPINIDDRVRFYEPNSSCFNPIPVVLLGTKRTNAWTHVGTIISHRIIPTL